MIFSIVHFGGFVDFQNDEQNPVSARGYGLFSLS
jgi:hypothetical protein